MASLTGLSNELKLMVIECLLELPESSNTTISDASSNGDKDMSDAETKKETIPGSGKLSHAAQMLLPLSCINRAFRELTAPFVFSTVVLRNTEKSGTSVQSLAESHYAHVVRQVDYVGYAPFALPSDTGVMNDEDPESGLYAPRDDDFPTSVQHVLQNLSKFPHLNCVSVSFPVSGYFPFVADYIVRPGMLFDKESEQRWHRLVRDSYMALARNAAGVFKKLELKSLVTVWSSAWDTVMWQKMLRNLEQFTVSFQGGIDANDCCVGKFGEYGVFTRAFFNMLFASLHSVTHIRIISSKDAPLGSGMDFDDVAPEIWPENTTAVGSDTGNPITPLPYLQHLEFDWIFIGNHLIAFLQSHASTLRSVSLIHSYAYTYGDGVKWRSFFKDLLATKPPFPVLERFHVDTKDRDEDFGDEMNDFLVGIADEDAFEEFQLVNASTNDRTGVIEITWDNGEGGEEEVEEWQEDHKYYDAFMALVEDNKKRLAA